MSQRGRSGRQTPPPYSDQIEHATAIELTGSQPAPRPIPSGLRLESDREGSLRARRKHTIGEREPDS